MPMHGDIFHVLFRCQSVSTPHIALLAQCLHARNPVLAVLAACFQVGTHNFSNTRDKYRVMGWRTQVLVTYTEQLSDLKPCWQLDVGRD